MLPPPPVRIPLVLVMLLASMLRPEAGRVGVEEEGSLQECSFIAKDAAVLAADNEELDEEEEEGDGHPKTGKASTVAASPDNKKKAAATYRHRGEDMMHSSSWRRDQAYGGGAGM